MASTPDRSHPATAPTDLPLEAFDYPFDPDLIAQRPRSRRDRSRLLLVRRSDGELEDRRFEELRELVAPGDVLVVNDTRVFPARLLGRKPTGASAEVLLLRPLDASRTRWMALVRPGGKLKPGRRVEVGDELSVDIEDGSGDGGRIVRLDTPLDPDEAVRRYGRVPLPPYIRRPDEPEDRTRYQTVYARRSGSVAAPTAGLHFTRSLVGNLEAKGVEIVPVTLHVGPGTFRPVETREIDRHRMDSEMYEVDEESAERIDRARDRGGRVWAVGTTVVRTLETVATPDGRVGAGQGWTDLFIRPPHDFRIVDRLITNFHLPRSTLLMLVAAFAGHELTLQAYRHAVERRYRFYSYGDSMAVV